LHAKQIGLHASQHAKQIGFHGRVEGWRGGLGVAYL
jgi:hypothetical protein